MRNNVILRAIAIILFAVICTVILTSVFAFESTTYFEGEKFNLFGNSAIKSDTSASHGEYISFDINNNQAYKNNLLKIQSQSYRNTSRDSSSDLYTPSNDLILENYYGPRSDYFDPIKTKGWNEGNITPKPENGNFRTDCEFSHFAYDDPIVHPNKPEKAHLHMFFGNTHVNAYSTYDTLINSGGGTCNGMELNRTGYWVPAIIDGDGNVRIPERALVYYKSFYFSKYDPPNKSTTEVYPERMQLVSNNEHNNWQDWQHPDGYGDGSGAFGCINSVNSGRYSYQDTIPNCAGGSDSMLEMNVKFQTCWNGADPTNYDDNFRVAQSGGSVEHYGSCPSSHPRYLTTIEYRILYPVSQGENSSSWFLSSDINPTTGDYWVGPGAASHGDWWGGWNREVNELFVENCNNVIGADCGHGFLGTGVSSPALKYREHYPGPFKINGADLYKQICTNDIPIRNPSDLAFCRP